MEWDNAGLLYMGHDKEPGGRMVCREYIDIWRLAGSG